MISAPPCRPPSPFKRPCVASGDVPFAEEAPVDTVAAATLTLVHRGNRAAAEQFAQELLLTCAAEYSCPTIAIEPLHRQKHRLQICFSEEPGDDLRGILALYRFQ